MRKIVFVILLVCNCAFAKAQLQIFSFKQLDSLQKIKEKNVFVFIYTDYCRYCKAMEQTVFKDSYIIDLLAKDYYFVKLNAEEQLPIVYKGREFIYKSNKGMHELAIALSNINGEIAFPATCILSNKNEILFQRNEFINSKDLVKILGFLH